ncbi:hypothetical protein [Desertivirga brevis]|uniref:hypothetical protein n=1 Tax=Desertivirga brevis TaxID=2810310 RepID=UPI001A962135|nr:hypothetical protein [Pedobacter sp. SYSU D00873]
MDKAEVEGQVKEILYKMAKRPSNTFLHTISNYCNDGKVDYNLIRKAVIRGFKSGDKNAVLLGSLLLQLEPHEVQALVMQRRTFN